MRSVKIENSVAEKVKDFKRHVRTREKLPVTEAQILSRAFEIAFERHDELLERLRASRGQARSDPWEAYLKPASGKRQTDAAKDHDAVEP